MTYPEKVLWLAERTELSVLSENALAAVAEVLEEKVVPAQTRLVQENITPDGLYILRQGRLEGDRINQSNSVWAISLLPGSIIHLPELLFGQLAQRTILALSECQLWFIPAAKFQELLSTYPEIQQAFAPKLAMELVQISSQLTYQQERQTVLRPYLVTKAKRGVVGKSRYAERLRQQIKQATNDMGSVLIFGEPGLEKDNMAALIHFSSLQRREPMIKLDCSALQASGVDLFGRAGGKPGLLEWLERGTLLLNNIQELPQELVPKIVHLLETKTFTPVGVQESETASSAIECQAKIIMISERTLPNIDRLVKHLIKVPPLRVRKADISDQLEYYMRLLCRVKGVSKQQVTDEALRRLQSYDFPGNLRELESLVERAIVQSSGAQILTEEVFWSVQTKKKEFRVNLLNAYPWLRRFLRSDWWPDRINYWFTFGFFALVIAILFLGPQSRQENFALNLFWAWWWPLILIAFPFVGRLWCAVCPFMIYGEITQKLSLLLWPRQLKRWPRQSAEKWGGWFLFGLFTLIFIWEELWNLENTAYLSACLLLLITAGAMIFSAIFERRFWCRYLCPIGGMNGLFAKLSMTELRAQQGTCSAECTTYQCYKGGPQKGEGLETNGCPLYSHPAQLEDNKDCVLCMTCLKACPHRSVELNLRPPGIELWRTHTPQYYEVALLMLLFGGIFLHRLPELNAWLGWNLDLTQFWTHLGFSVAVLLSPTLITFVAYGWIKLAIWWNRNQTQNFIKPRPFVELAYGYLPLVLGGNVAHYLRLGLGEAGRILPVSLATFGLNGESLPIIVAHPAVIAFLQGVTLVFSVICSVILTQKIARQSFRCLLPQHLATILLCVGLWVIIVN